MMDCFAADIASVLALICVAFVLWRSRELKRLSREMRAARDKYLAAAQQYQEARERIAQ